MEVDRPPALLLFGTELELHAELRASIPYGARLGGSSAWDARTLRGAVDANIERPFGAYRLVSATTIAAVVSSHPSLTPPQELVYLGGPTTGPGYDYHSIVSRRAFSEHVELRMPAPFPEFSLGRFGRVPGRGTFAPFLHVIGATSNGLIGGLYPSLGAGYLMPFDLLRIDVARGLRDGRWTFSIDVSRQFWSIL